MDAHAMLRHLMARRHGPAPAEQEDAGEGDRPAVKSQSRQEHLARLRRSGIPAWSESPERCDVCGRQLLTGERATLFERTPGLVLACPLCAEKLIDDGALYVPFDSSPEQGRLDLAS